MYNSNWSKRLCNGCYGRLLAIYEIKAGTDPDDQRADKLDAALLSVVSEEELRQAERQLMVAEKRAEMLSPESVRFIATAEYVAKQLQSDFQLEWSAAVIGLCKAVELEVINRLLQPLAAQTQQDDLEADKNDKDLGRVAIFCANPTLKPPELGAFARFLQTAIHSQARRESSTLLKRFLKLAANWTGSNWILDPAGLHEGLVSLTTNFRNRAAHIDELAKDDYRSCEELVIGTEGLVWKLVMSTRQPKRPI